MTSPYQPIYETRVHSIDSPNSRSSDYSLTNRVTHLSITRDIANSFLPISISQAVIEVSNHDGLVSPKANSMMTINNYITVDCTYASSFYSLFVGKIFQTRVEARPLGSRLIIYARGTEEVLQKVTLNTAMLNVASNVNFGSRMAAQVTFSVSSIDISTFTETLKFCYDLPGRAIDQVTDLLKLNNAWAWFTPGGQFVCKPYSYAVLGTSTYSYNAFYSLSIARNLDKIINEVYLVGEDRQYISTTTSLFALQDPVFIPKSSTSATHIDLQFTFKDPVTNEDMAPVLSLTNSTYRTANTRADGTGTDVTANLALGFGNFQTYHTVIAQNNNANSGIWMTSYYRTGFLMRKNSIITISASDDVSRTQYGTRTKTINSHNFSQQSYMQTFANYLISRYKDPRDEVSMSLKNIWPENLKHNVGDLISVVDTLNGVDNIFIATHVTHDINTDKGVEHITTFNLESHQ